MITHEEHLAIEYYKNEIKRLIQTIFRAQIFDERNRKSVVGFVLQEGIIEMEKHFKGFWDMMKEMMEIRMHFLDKEILKIEDLEKMEIPENVKNLIIKTFQEEVG